MAVMFGITKVCFFKKKSKKFRIIKTARFVAITSLKLGIKTGILEKLRWMSLKKRRRDSRLILVYKGLMGTASNPTDDLIIIPQ